MSHDHSFAAHLKLSDPPISFLFKVVLLILGPLHFHVNFGISVSLSTKKPAGISIGVILNLQISLRRTESSDPLTQCVSIYLEYFLSHVLPFSCTGLSQLLSDLPVSILHFYAIINGTVLLI